MKCLVNDDFITIPYGPYVMKNLRNGHEAKKAEEIIMKTFTEIKVTWITAKPKEAENANVSWPILFQALNHLKVSID